MDYPYILLVVIASLIIAFGILGIILPMYPGIPLIFIGILLFAIFTNFQKITILTTIILTILMLLSLVIDYLLIPLLGIKKSQISPGGLWGGFLGLILGIIFSPLTLYLIIILPICGVIGGDLLFTKKMLPASKIELETKIALLSTTILNITIAGTMIYLFVKAVL